MSLHRPGRGRRRLPSHYAPILLPLILSLMMSCIVSAVATLRTLGFSPDFFALWPGAWALSWIVAFPTLLILLPLARRIVGLLIDPPPA
ncbi:DUF2798 domain-containing protein [Enterovirga rhinocerotis]|uniref:Uncharacterized protein DUF2798 n=1 Tax=Enterovirga rhinocerotis TaxID=1339210 RepID=A0A4R7BVM6_9HYPH|nr:DUF2798 domain-containing protein [Enterovirga rhinocerotis]TDR89132.1 uncharacterized protein DUF2798 [Enterovirga rhinocerotis]